MKIGDRFGKLLVVGEAPTTAQGRRWICQCDCGATRVNTTAVLNAGRVVSCGCAKRSYTHRKKHGHSNSPTYVAWCNMRQRCGNEKATGYARYGGRGIRVCDRWSSFENFLADMGEAPPGMQLERKDNNGDYAPDNCRWATRLDQANNKRNSKYFERDGKNLTISQWSRELGVSVRALYFRLDAHGTIFID